MSDTVELFVGYIPVIHDGYIQAFNRHPNATIGIFDTEVLSDLAPYLRKDIRALSPEDAQKAISGLGRNSIIIDKSTLADALKRPIVMPDDDISRAIIAANPDAKITTEPIFLRWDRDNVNDKSAIIPDRVVQIDSDDSIAKLLNDESNKSTNWWRHVGAVVVNDQLEIIAGGHSSSVPSEYSSWIDSDPRITTNRGLDIEKSIDIHAESRIIAEASKTGKSLAGTTIYVTTFPCPSCAKLIALSGIKCCYYIDGYATLDGYKILKDFDIEVVKLNTKLGPEDPNSLKTYPTNQS